MTSESDVLTKMWNRVTKRQQPEAGVDTDDSEFYQQKATESLDNWSEHACTLYYCDLCQQVFVSFDIFYDHREASEYDIARRTDEDGYQDQRELEPGDEFPEFASVGGPEPCKPTHLTDGEY